MKLIEVVCLIVIWSPFIALGYIVNALIVFPVKVGFQCSDKHLEENSKIQPK